jgi:DNA-binding PadR family transcriptional regulator
MSEAEDYEAALLRSWTETHKKGTLVLFILLAVSDHPSWSGEINTFIHQVTEGYLQVDEQSLHRALRRLDALNVITHYAETAAGTGAKRKIYDLTVTGESLLRRYLETTMAYTRNPRYAELSRQLIDVAR